MNPKFRRKFRHLQQKSVHQQTKCNEIFDNKWLCLTAVSLFWET